MICDIHVLFIILHLQKFSKAIHNKLELSQSEMSSLREWVFDALISLWYDNFTWSKMSCIGHEGHFNNIEKLYGEGIF